MMKATLSLTLTLLSVCLATVAVAQYGAMSRGSLDGGLLDGGYGGRAPRPNAMGGQEGACGDLGQACCGPEERAALGTDIPCPLSPGISCCDGLCIQGTACASDDKSDEGDAETFTEEDLAGFEMCGDLGELCCNHVQREFFEVEVPCFKSEGISCCDGVCIEGTACASDEK